MFDASPELVRWKKFEDPMGIKDLLNGIADKCSDPQIIKEIGWLTTYCFDALRYQNELLLYLVEGSYLPPLRRGLTPDKSMGNGDFYRVGIIQRSVWLDPAIIIYMVDPTGSDLNR